MFKSSRAIRRPDRYAARLAALTLCAPIWALAGVTTTEPTELANQAPAADKTLSVAGSYQIRCWQYGRLLFEENQFTLAIDASQYSLKLSGTDRNGQPIYVAETKSATCLIRHARDERAWPANPR
jgi:hypothetical protein